MNLLPILKASRDEGLINQSEYFRLTLCAMQLGETITLDSRAEQNHMLTIAKTMGKKVTSRKQSGTGFLIWRV